jgi:hypothetical protein
VHTIEGGKGTNSIKREQTCKRLKRGSGHPIAFKLLVLKVRIFRGDWVATSKHYNPRDDNEKAWGRVDLLRG